MATTTNYGWTTPDNTALVKDGASAIRTLGSSVDTSLKSLSPGTTAGDVDYYTSSTAKARLGIGSTGQVLTVSAGVPAWTTLSGGGSNWSLLNSGGTALTGATTVTVSGISSKDKIMVFVEGTSNATGVADLQFRLNTDTGGNYYVYGGWAAADTGTTQIGYQSGSYSGIIFAKTANNASTAAGYLYVTGANASGVKAFEFGGGSGPSGVAAGQRGYWGGGYYNSATVISSISIFSSSGNLDAGTVYVYTSAA